MNNSANGNIRSSAFCLPAVNNALQLANPGGLAWQTTNETQKRYFEQYGKSDSDLNSLVAYLKGKVTRSASELNAWFAENGWPNMNINLPSNGLGIGSIFDLLVDWTVPGKKKDRGVAIQQNDKWIFYEGAEMRPSQGLRAYQLEGYEYPMFELETRQDGWKVFLVEADGPCESLDLPNKAIGLLTKNRTNYEFSKLQFPVVQLETDVDTSWMEGMAVEGGFRIDEAIKKVKLRLDDKGARAQSAVAFIMRGLESGVYTLAKPFYVIFWREGLEFPAFVAISASDSWIKAKR
jgi:hypothetical protein